MKQLEQSRWIFIVTTQQRPMRRPKIAIVAYYFAPDEVVGAVRPENWATWLSSHAQVTVVTKQAANNTDVQKAYVVARPAAPIFRLIERAATWWLRRRKAKSPEGPHRTARTTSGALRYRMPCLIDFWMLAAFRGLTSVRPDVIIATHSPYISLVVAAIYKVLHPKVHLVLDMRDLWTGNPKNSGVSGLRLIEATLEQWVQRHASASLTVSRVLREHLAKRFPNRPVYLVYNSPHHALPRTSTPSRPRDSTQVVLVYTGTFYPQYDCGELFTAIKQWEREGICSPQKLCLQVASRDTAPFVAHAAANGVGDYVRDFGHLTRIQAAELQSRADVLLLCETTKAGQEGTLTGKVFEYLATSRPILLLGPPLASELCELIAEHRPPCTIPCLRQMIADKLFRPSYSPVDYSELAKRQLLTAITSLKLSQQ